jgi:hypothetical protein
VVGWAALLMALERKILYSIQSTWNEDKRVINSAGHPSRSSLRTFLVDNSGPYTP